ncbi:ABC transporter permease [Paenibacillus sp. p3-SID1389]|uniref:ABC transporter permease n=1 Tax=Paenibacillus sp. p3-SID1389 TaxID=2916364 RepID=UPI0021A59E91|nr:ABC transporter permease [Paenibacillus sp. p3-SID1389]MCT2196868.1 ABC transporter permease [Paenibacillus sp. p3-SID1389]
MNNFLALVQNENMKIYRRVRTWIMFGLLVLLTILFGVLFSLDGGSQRLSAWDALDQLSFLYYLVSIYAAVIAADIVAGEFTWGTIKLLLIRPWTRTKVLLSKLLAVLLFTLAMSAVFFAIALAVSFLIFPNEPSQYLEASPLSRILESLLYSYIDLLVIAAFSFMLSTVFRSSGIAIGLSIFILFAGNIFTLLFHPSRYAWAKYLLFTNMDLGQYRGGQVGPAGMTLGFSITVLAVYVLLFLAVAWLVFKKRDVAA